MNKVHLLKLNQRYYQAYLTETPNSDDLLIKYQIEKTKETLEKRGYDVEVILNVDIESIEKDESKIYIFHVECGNMPAHKAIEHVQNVKKDFCKSSFLKEADCLFFAKSNKKGSSVTTIDKTERRVFYIDVGNASPEKAVQYLKNIKEEIKSSSDMYNDGLFLPKDKIQISSIDE